MSNEVITLLQKAIAALQDGQAEKPPLKKEYWLTLFDDGALHIGATYEEATQFSREIHMQKGVAPVSRKRVVLDEDTWDVDRGNEA